MKDVNLLINNGVNVQKSLELFGDMATYDDTLHDFLSEVEGKLARIKAFKEVSDMAKNCPNLPKQNPPRHCPVTGLSYYQAGGRSLG